MSYPELLAHSNFSLLEGASHPEEMVQAAATMGISHLGLADRDAVYGLVRAHAQSRRTGVALVCGATLTVREHPAASVLVESRQGWSALTRLLTDARAGHDKGYADVSVERLCQAGPGLTVVLRPGWTPQQAAPLRQAFKGHLEVLVSARLSPGDASRLREATELARRLDLPLLASNDPWYHHPRRHRVADVLTAVRRGIPLDQCGRWLQANASAHLLSEEEFLHRFAHLPQAVRRARQVAERCHFSLDSLAYRYPQEVIPQGYTAMGWLRERVRQGMAQRWPQGAPDHVHELVAHELSVIEQLDFPHYFLTVDDIVRFARGQGILCQGRGSAANSAVCFALGITSVDPSRMTVLFERFISAERGEPPDIDVDFEHERREEVIQYIYQRYGRHRAALVDEVNTWRRRSAIRDLGKAFGLSLDQVDRLAKSTDRWSAGDLAQLDELVVGAGRDPSDHRVRLTLEVADEVRGFPRHLSQHVGGFVIAAGDLTELVPVEPATMPDRTVIQWDKDDVDVLRFVKVDVLGLGILTAIRKSFDLLRSSYGLDYDLATVPAEDPAVYDMFCRADTVGVFQIESRAQMSMLPRLKPRSFYDLVIEVSIVRPGPIQGGMVHPYLARRAGEEPVTYAHPDLEPILERTLGVPIFQEQVMKMASVVGGFTPGQADQLRRAMGAWRKRGGLDLLGRDLVQGMLDRGISPEYAQAIFKQILGFGEYGFPESHAASFALLVYVSGWLKCHHPEVWAAALINSQPMGFYSPRSIVADARRHQVQVRPVSVVHSHWDCTLEPTQGPRHALRLGMRLVRGLSEPQATALVQARQQAPFRDLPDLARRTRLDQGALQVLADADAMADLGVDRRQAAWILQGLWTGLPLFAGLPRQEPEASLPPTTPGQELHADYRSVGLSLQRHPMDPHRESLSAEGVVRLCELSGLPTGSRVRLAGLVSSRQRPGTAKGVVFMTLVDETGMANLVIWPKVWATHRRLGRAAVLLGADGRLQRQDDAVSVLVERLWEVGASPRVRSRDFR